VYFDLHKHKCLENMAGDARSLKRRKLPTG